ncbi:MAG: UDP-N-acetylmuramoyl-tripeptide--D-alanyl-D-alanine ligase [Candidatus Omnitrophica bacterium]|nr:UDP-N-acetylmuramoyl-tripeptide--D-alanyl-D-alanine ligase [Candidatus Omnitrophota bacterium]MDD5660979.1 UDP-N-acetylmuramoyl-tripeptide--D-alanyl-D-alanine ligase [Candidatus Omnitrophota bacterium]
MFSVEEIVKATTGKLIHGSFKDRVSGISTDSRKLKPQEAFLALKGNNFDGHDFIEESLKSNISALIVERVPDHLPLHQVALIKVKDTALALGNIARFQRQKFNVPVIAITGSNGKTTTKEMVAWVLSLNSKVLKTEGTKNNQIGLPQTLIQLSQKDDFAVVEIGTNHFGEVDYLAKIAKPNIGIITNIGLSHIEFLNNLRGVLKEKSSLLDNLAQPAFAVVNADDKLLKGIITQNNKRKHVFSYGIHEKSDFSASVIRLKGGKLEFKVNRKFDFALSTLGYYNTYNALGAISIGRLLGLGYPEMSCRLAAFKFPKGRLNLVDFKGLKFIDDTYNSNPLSLRAALAALDGVRCKGKKILIMGDMLELGKQKELLHRQIARSITNTCDILLTVGSLARFTAEAAEKIGFKNVFCCDSSEEARNLLFNKISPGPCDFILVKGSRAMRMEEIFSV